MRKVILTCAVTGEAQYNPRHPSFPITPQQIADAAREADDAGASCVHLHVRDPETGAASRDPDLFLDMATRVRDHGVGAIMNITCGGGAYLVPDPETEEVYGPGSDVASAAERVRHIEICRPELCSLDVTTQNQRDGGKAYVYLNPEHTLYRMAGRFRELGVKPEIEIFAPGDLMLARQMIDDGLIDAPPLFQFVTGNQWGLPTLPETVTYMRNLLPEGAIWAAFGLGRMQMPMVAQSVIAGGHVRVGLEDNLYLSKGVFATNGELVERARTIIECLGYQVASPDEAREMLGIGH